MRVHYINVQQVANSEQAGRNSSGGKPLVTGNQQWPSCGICRKKMVLFFQLDIDKKFDLPIKPGSHLLVFMCPVHNDAPTELVAHGDSELPEAYWTKDFGHYKLILNKNPLNEHFLEDDEFIKPAKLVFRAEEEDIDWDGRVEKGTPGFKVGGVPSWEMEPEHFKCSCGAEMIFIAQIPPAFMFDRLPNAPLQPDSLHPDGYNVFMGKASYIFACKEQCEPESLYVVAQENYALEQNMTA